MRISAGNPTKAQAFLNGKWTGWMDTREAQRLEDAQNWGKNPKGIIPLDVAVRLGIAPAGVASTDKSAN